MDYKTYSVLLGLALFSLNSCINKNRKLCEGHSEGLGFNFTLPFNIKPSIDTINVGDTLWLESSFSNNIYNKNNNKYYTIEDFDFDVHLVFLDLNTNPVKGTSNLKFYTSIGNNNTNGGDIKINYNYSNNFYNYKCGIIFNKPGYYLSNFYSFITTNYLSYHNRKITNCPYEMLDLSFECNNSQDNNYYMLEHAIDPSQKQLSLNNFNSSGGFCVYIK